MSLVLAALALYIAAVHVIGGQRRVVAPLDRSDIGAFAGSTLHVVWHVVSFMLVATAVLLAAYGDRLDAGLRGLLAAQLAVAAVVFLVRAQRAHGAGFALPQWILLGPLAVGIVLPHHVAPLLIAAIGALHVAWLFGVSWPSPSRAKAPLYVIGWREGVAMPSRAATAAVVVVLAGMAWATWRGPHLAALAVAGVFAARGLGGLVESRFRPVIVGTPYQRLSVLFYSPLCLFLALLIVTAP